MKRDIDAGTLSAAEISQLETYTAEQRTEDLLYFHLKCAQSARRNADNMKGNDSDYYQELTRRERALLQAAMLARDLRVIGYPFSKHVIELMECEVTS
jgi:hypothetical protein